MVGKSDTGSRSVWRFYPDFVIDCSVNPLFVTEIAFGCLNRNVTEQKLDLPSEKSLGLRTICPESFLLRCGRAGN